MNNCVNCKNLEREIKKLRNDNIKLKENIISLENIVKILKNELEEIKINNYDSIDEYFS
jgi:predicted RNase H-like nuclease (RuvC/YqgF family)